MSDRSALTDAELVAALSRADCLIVQLEHEICVLKKTISWLVGASPKAAGAGLFQW
jgi:hypothetical protein